MDFTLGHAADLLRRTPASLSALLLNVPEPWARGTEGPDTFSPFDNIGHLIDGEETDWMPRARLILARGPSVRFEPYDRFRHRARNEGRSLESLLVEFENLRSTNLHLLQSWRITDVELALPGEHPALGAVTLGQLLAAWVVHDLGHVAQIARVMAKQYTDEVGPWRQFLPVLTDRTQAQNAVPVPRPDLSSRPLRATCERLMAAPPHVIFQAWTSPAIARWFAAPGTVLMTPDVNVPYFFEAQFEGQRHPHHGRFLRLETDRLVEMTWLTAAGTKGVETVLTIELMPSGAGTDLRLTHAGFPDEESRAGHAENWPIALDYLDKAFPATP